MGQSTAVSRAVAAWWSKGMSAGAADWLAEQRLASPARDQAAQHVARAVLLAAGPVIAPREQDSARRPSQTRGRRDDLPHRLWQLPQAGTRWKAQLPDRSTTIHIRRPLTMSGSQASPPRPGQPSHTRTYQACIPCRRRKVRCDLGPVDNPHDPPCVRCRRESKECFFSATRRKRKQDGDDEPDEADDYELRNARKRSRPSDVEHHEPAPNGAAYVSQPLTPGGSVGRYEPLRRPTTAASLPPVEHSEEDIQVNNESVATLQTGEIYSGHDALNLLFEAARNGAMDLHHRTASASSLQRPALGSTPGSNFAASPQVAAPHARSSSRAA
ncbi:hypothetical protein SVAN01_09974, partial [Stagonosporopsis vannaccii]